MWVRIRRWNCLQGVEKIHLGTGNSTFSSKCAPLPDLFLLVIHPRQKLATLFLSFLTFTSKCFIFLLKFFSLFLYVPTVNAIVQALLSVKFFSSQFHTAKQFFSVKCLYYSVFNFSIVCHWLQIHTQGASRYLSQWQRKSALPESCSHTVLHDRNVSSSP